MSTDQGALAARLAADLRQPASMQAVTLSDREAEVISALLRELQDTATAGELGGLAGEMAAKLAYRLATSERGRSSESSL